MRSYTVKYMTNDFKDFYCLWTIILSSLDWKSNHFIILGIDQEVENDSGSDDEYEQAEGSDVEQDSGDEGSDMEEGGEQGSDGEEDSDGEGEEVSFINNYCC